MKLLSFILGFITGIVGVNLYDIFVNPVMPSDPEALQGWDSHINDALRYSPFLADDPDDTQPVKVR